MRVWLDDIRQAPEGWKWVKTAKEAIDLIETGEVTDISLDHDLGPSKAGTGAQVANAIEKLAWEGRIRRISWRIHSMNPVGVENMKRALQSADRLWDASEVVDNI